MNGSVDLDTVITPRGTAIASAGIVLGGLGVGFASPVLATIGIVLVATAVVSGIWIMTALSTFTQRYPFARREVEPRPLAVSSPGVVTVKVLAARAAPRRWRPRSFSESLDIREQAAAELTGGAGTKATVTRRSDSLTLVYHVNPVKRGRWPLGPALVHTTDPLGLFWSDAIMGDSELIPVWPAVVDLSAAAGALMGQADRVVIGARSPAPDDAALRDYQEGDDLRRVHWPSTARRGAMVVRSDERAGRRPATIVVDLPRDGEALERTVSGAASIGVAVLDSGHPVRLLGGGLDTSTSHHIGRRATHQSRSSLLDLTLDMKAPLSAEAAAARLIESCMHLGTELTSGEVVIALIEPVDRDALEAMVPLGDTGHAWAIVRSDGDPLAADNTVKALRRAGWLAMPYSASDSWQHVWTTMVSSGGIE